MRTLSESVSWRETLPFLPPICVCWHTQYTGDKPRIRGRELVDDHSVRTADLIGAITANTYFLLMIAMLAARIAGLAQPRHWLGAVSVGIVFPLVYLLIAARSADRPPIYFVWLGLMILFLVVEVIVDYILKLDFRSDQRIVIPYVMLFFGATGGMIGLAAQAGSRWAAVTGIMFLVMAALAFISRAKTGL